MQPKAFDNYAPHYDNHFTHSLIGRAQREKVYKYLSEFTIPKIKNVLEVNCGTGEDALWMAKKGLSVLATDVSEGMIHVAEQKDTSKIIQFKQLNNREIGLLKPNTYNLIFSNFGGLNCLNGHELNEFKNGCNQLQEKNDQVAFVIMGTQCWWEKAFFRLRKEKEKASRRQNKNGTDTIIDGVSFKTYYYSPDMVRLLFDETYHHIATRPIGLFVPPSYLENFFKSRKTIFKGLVWLDTLFSKCSFLSNYADHFLIIMKKK